MAEQDVVVRVAKSLKVGQTLLRGLVQHLADVAALTKEVVGLREANVRQRGKLMGMASDIVVLRGQLDALVGRTDRMGFGKRMI